jgi:HlyD family secretion protein
MTAKIFRIQKVLHQVMQLLFLGSLIFAVCWASAIALPNTARAGSKQGVSALGFVEPEGGVLHLSGISSSRGAVVADLKIREGETVTKGQVIAILDNHEILNATLKQADADVEIAQANLQLVKAGISKSTIKAQKARINGLNEEIKTAAMECKRIKTLRNRDVISASAAEQKCLAEKILRAKLHEAKAILAALSEVRQVDIAVSQAEVHKAKAAVLKVKAELARSVIKSPLDGQVLKLHTKAGELIGLMGIVELGQTAHMWIRAEVYETDAARVQVGQQAVITSDGFSGQLQGIVEGIGLIIGKNELLSDDPTANKDARVVEVKIKLNAEDSPMVSRMINLQVTVIILTEEKHAA